MIQSELSITIADEGPGIPPETLNKILNGEILRNPANQEQQLSFYICCRLLKALRGKISGNSVVTRGTVFKVVIPC
jgi:sensor histidine kinase regulating citrate/malate metabolism